MVKSIGFYAFIFIGLAAIFIGIRAFYILRKSMKKGIGKKAGGIDIIIMKMIDFPIYCLCLIFGLGMLFFLVPKKCYVLGKLIKTGIRTEAVLVDIVVRSSGGNSIKYPVFEYTDQSGTVNRFKNNSSLISDSKIGDVVDILYHPDTKVAMVDSFYGLYFGLVFMLFVGGLLTLVGGAGVRGSLKNNSEPMS